MKDGMRFIHITDTHIGPTKDTRVGVNVPYPRVEAVINRIKSLPFSVDCVIHTGDVVYDPDDQAYELARELFAQLNLPVYYVAGNHDSNAAIWKCLPMPEVERPFKDKDWLCYAFEIGNTQFVTLDAQCPRPWIGTLAEEQLDFLKSKSSIPGKNLVVLLHYPPFSMDNPWSDNCMLLEEPEKLHSILLASKSRVAAVLYGHIHSLANCYRDNILYSTTTSAASELEIYPGETELKFSDIHVPGFHVISVDSSSTVMKYYPCPVR